MICLTHHRTACTAEATLLGDIVYPQRAHFFPDVFAKVKNGLSYVPHKVAEKVLDPELIKHLRENPVGKTAFVLAAGNAHFAGMTPKAYPDNTLNYGYKFMPFTLTQVWAGRIAQQFGQIDLVVTDSSACASSLKVMQDVEMMIRYQNFKRVIVLTVEDGVSNTVLEFFGESKAVLTAKEEGAGIIPSAFDSKNKKFRIGQGAALAVFDHFSVADNPTAALIAANNASEASTNPIGQREDGEGFTKAIKELLQNAWLHPHEVKIIKTHGTGTDSNNAAEKNALLSMFTDFVATSYKPRIGHTMGASGLLETLLLLEEVRMGKVPAILNRTEKDDVFLSHDAEAPEGLILSLAAGMGNIYSAAIFKLLR
jgi:3-oxoacyl-(acyl-carrier-protein) synthase